MHTVFNKRLFSSSLLFFYACHLPQLALGHGYLSIPPSRNTIEGATYEPQSANRGGVCGTITSGSPNFNDVQWVSAGGSYISGQTFQADVVITAHHKGHFEFRLCTDPSELNQACFDQNVLQRADTTVTASPKDLQYPSRWYLPPSVPDEIPEHTYSMQYTLPAGVTCDKCVLQWTYITANSCSPKGYNSFFAEHDASGATNSSWHMGWMGTGDQGTCNGREDSQWVGGAPEKFWSCADIEIVPAGPSESPTPPPPSEPTAAVTAAPTHDDGDRSCETDCAACVSVPEHIQNADDAQCAPCANGGQSWWPCNIEGLCRCHSAAGSAAPTTTAPPDATTAAPTQAATQATIAPTAMPSEVTPLPSEAPTTAPKHDCSGCTSCVSVAGNCANATHAQCSACANGQWWWPCNVQGACECAVPSTSSPSTAAPSLTAAPSIPATGGTTPTPEATTAPTSSSAGDTQLLEVLSGVDWSDILKAQQPDLSWMPSTVYKSADLIVAVQKMTEIGVGEYKLLAGDGDQNARYALVNIAAFLAQSMQETIQYDACDENNWDSTSGYTAANACGQLGQSYQDYKCSPDEEHMQCDVDPEMEIVASTHAKWYGAPAPLFCGSKAKVPKAPKWSSSSGWCDPSEWPSWTPWASVQEFFDALAAGIKCSDYQNQKAGSWEQCAGEGCPNAPAPNFGQAARTDVEGCCWWGRGVIQTTGVCNFGKLNYFAGARAAREGRTSMFPDVDFCKTPDKICTSTAHPELKWVAGLFYWTKEVQGYPTTNAYQFNYLNELKQFTDAANVADSSFIDKCSGIVNRGCPSRTSCPAGAVHEVEKRSANFRTVLSAFGFPWASRRATAPATPSATPPVGSSCADGCTTCVSVFHNQQSATDEQCSKCALNQTSWPCTADNLCTCLHEKTVAPLTADQWTVNPL